MKRADSGRRVLTTPSRIGMVTETAPEKMRLSKAFGLFGSDLNIWFISGILPYRTGLLVVSAGVLGSDSTESLKAFSLYAFDDPKEPITMLASRGAVDRRNCIGMSL